MKLALDFISIIIFFLVYNYYDIFYATGAMMVTYTITFVFSLLTNKKLDKTILATWLLVVVLGGMTIFFHNAEYIKYKPTLIYWFFALAFHISPYLKDEKSIMERMAGHQIELPKKVWLYLNRFWMFIFYALGLVNLYIAYTFTTEQWVYFKTFGIITILIVATGGQVLYMSKYLKNQPEDK